MKGHTKCSRCGGQDSGCYVCKPETEAAPEWPTRQEIEEMREQAQEVLGNTKAGYLGVSACAEISSRGYLLYCASGYIGETGDFFIGSGGTPEECINSLAERVKTKADENFLMIKKQAEQMGLTVTKIKP